MIVLTTTAFVCALMALGAFLILGWVLVNLFRVLKPILQSYVEFYERLARYNTAVQFDVDKRVMVINEAIKKGQDFSRVPAAKVPDEAPLPNEMRGPQILDDAAEKLREAEYDYGGEWPSRDTGIAQE